MSGVYKLNTNAFSSGVWLYYKLAGKKIYKLRLESVLQALNEKHAEALDNALALEGKTLAQIIADPALKGPQGPEGSQSPQGPAGLPGVSVLIRSPMPPAGFTYTVQTVMANAGMGAYTWTIKAAMPTVRTYLAAAVVNGRVYASGGFGGISASNLNEKCTAAAVTLYVHTKN